MSNINNNTLSTDTQNLNQILDNFITLTNKAYEDDKLVEFIDLYIIKRGIAAQLITNFTTKEIKAFRITLPEILENGDKFYATIEIKDGEITGSFGDICITKTIKKDVMLSSYTSLNALFNDIVNITE